MDSWYKCSRAVRIYIYIYVCVYIYIYIYTHLYTCVSIYLCIYITCICICICMYTHTDMYTYMFIHIYIYIYIYVSTHIYIYIYVYTYIHTHICIHTHAQQQLMLRRQASEGGMREPLREPEAAAQYRVSTLDPTSHRVSSLIWRVRLCARTWLPTNRACHHGWCCSPLQSISEFSSCFFGPRPWHIEIRHRVKKISITNLFGFETLKLKIRRLKFWKPTVSCGVPRPGARGPSPGGPRLYNY